MVCRARPSLQRVVSSPGKRIQQLKQETVSRKGIWMSKEFRPWDRGQIDLLDNREQCVEWDHHCRGWSAVLERGPNEQKAKRARDWFSVGARISWPACREKMGSQGGNHRVESAYSFFQGCMEVMKLCLDVFIDHWKAEHGQRQDWKQGGARAGPSCGIRKWGIRATA